MKRLTLVLLPLLSACGSLAVPEPATYRLTPAAVVKSSADPLTADLTIDTPRALESLDSTRIAFVAPDSRQTFFRNVAWADRAPVMIADDLVQSFQASSAWRSVEPASSGIRADYLLQGDLIDCEAFGSASGKTDRVKVAITFTLVRASDRKPAGSVRMERTVAVFDTSFDRVIEGFDAATKAITVEAIEWTRTTADTAR